MKEITISPITRLEGHAKISIFLDGKGNVAKALMRVGSKRWILTIMKENC